MDNRGHYGAYPHVNDPTIFSQSDEEVHHGWTSNVQPSVGLSQMNTIDDFEQVRGTYAFRAEPVEDIQPTQPTGESIRGDKGVRQRNFTEKEDCLLASAWLNVSVDAIHGTDQSSRTYWGRITEYYACYKEAGMIERNQKSLTSRWTVISHEVSKYCGWLQQVQRRNQSGCTEADKVCPILLRVAYNSVFPFNL